MKRITQKEISEELGLSRATVSLVLNEKDKGRIPVETKQKILILANRLGYLPPSQKMARAGSIALIYMQGMANILNSPYYNEIYKGLEEVLKTRNYLITFVIPEENLVNNLVPEPILRKKVDGVVIFGTVSELLLKRLQDASVKTVLLNFSSPLEIDSVWFDNYEIINMMLEHLCSLGHKKIALVVPNELKGRKNFEQRIVAYKNLVRQKMRQREFILKIPGTNEMEKEIVKQVELEIISLLNNGVTAFLGISDKFALEILKNLKRIGIKVPENVNVAGIDDIEDAATSRPPLTTVFIPRREMGRIGGERIIKKIEEGEERVLKIFLPTKLVIRGSTGPISNISGYTYKKTKCSDNLVCSIQRDKRTV